MLTPARLPYYEIDFSNTQLDDAEELEYYKQEHQRIVNELKNYRPKKGKFRMGMI